MPIVKPPRGRPPVNNPAKLAEYNAQKAAYIEYLHAHPDQAPKQGKYAGIGAGHTVVVPNIPAAPKKTPEEMIKETASRFETLRDIAQSAAAGETRALIVSGAGGIGKSFTIEEIVKMASDEYGINYVNVSGIVTPVMLFKLLWDNQTQNDVLVLDDSDGVFSDEQTLTILKAALDSKPVRKVTWMAASKVLAADDIPSTFEYQGTIIFITNLPLHTMAASNSKIAHHLQALITRAVYIDLKLYTVEQVVSWIKHVVLKNDILVEQHKVSPAQQKEIVDYLCENVSNLRDVSIRAACHIAGFMKSKPEHWKQMAVHAFWK